MTGRNITRRDFLKATASACGAALLASCAPKVVEVEKEKVVKETVVVAGTPEVVEKVVEVTAVPQGGGVRATVGKEGTPLWKAPDLTGKSYILWGLQYDPHVEAYNRLAKWFEAYTGAKATVEPQPWPIENKVIAGMAAGTVPDVVCIMGKQIAPLILQDAVVPVDDAIFPVMNIKPEEWFSPVAIQAYQYFGKTWGIPVEGNAVSGVVNVRMDFLQEKGEEWVTKWPTKQEKTGFASFEDMWAMAKELQVTEADGSVSRWGLSSQGWENRHWFGIMRTLGKDWWDPGAEKFNLNSPEAEEGMYLQAYKPVWELKIETVMQEAFDTALFAGKVAVGCGNVVIPGFGRQRNIYIEQCVYPPAKPGVKPLFVGEGGWGFVVPAQAKERDLGVEFLKFMSTYDGQKEYARIYGGMIPGVPLVGEDPEIFPRNDYVGDGLRMVSAVPWDSGY